MRSRRTFIIIQAHLSICRHLGPRTSYIFPSKLSDQLNSSSDPSSPEALGDTRSILAESRPPDVLARPYAQDPQNIYVPYLLMVKKR